MGRHGKRVAAARIFALAALMDDAERAPTRSAALLPIRDTLFLGPLLVILFNWVFSHALVAMPPEWICALRAAACAVGRRGACGAHARPANRGPFRSLNPGDTFVASAAIT